MVGPVITTHGLVSGTQEDAAIIVGQWAVGAGTANVITAAYDPEITELFDGLTLGVRLDATNTEIDPTFEPESLGAHTIVKGFGEALEPGDLPGEAILKYNADDEVWVLLNPMVRFREPTTHWGTVGGTVDVLTLTLSPALGALGAAQDGMLFGGRASGANTVTTPTLAISGFTARTIKKLGAQALVAGDIPRVDFEALWRFHYHATTPWFELLNPVNVTSVSGDVSKYLAADTNGSDSSTAQPFMPTAGAATLAVGTYRFYIQAHISRAAGADSHTTGFLMAAAATIGWINGVIKCNLGDTAALVANHQIPFSVATETVFKAASTSTTEQIVVEITGRINITVAGTVTPQFKYSAAPNGGVPTVKRGAIVIFQPITANPQGTWS